MSSGSSDEQLSLDLLLDTIGEPQQAQLAELAEHLRSKDVGQRGVDAIGRIHVPVGKAPSQRLGAHVDELDLVRASHHRVGNGLR